ncbi:MAG: hypothetical protein AB1457_16190 [Chloroflexota bacterium]
MKIETEDYSKGLLVVGVLIALGIWVNTLFICYQLGGLEKAIVQQTRLMEQGEEAEQAGADLQGEVEHEKIGANAT